MTTEPEYTPEILMGQYILGAYMLGAAFPDQPPGSAYVDSSVTAMLQDLREHGYTVSETAAAT